MLFVSVRLLLCGFRCSFYRTVCFCSEFSGF